MVFCYLLGLLVLGQPCFSHRIGVSASRSRIDLSPACRPVVNSSPAVTESWAPSAAHISLLHQLLFVLKPIRSFPHLHLVPPVQELVDVGLIYCLSQMPEPEWMTWVKCGFGMYERRSVLLCSSCSVNYYDYCEVSANCDCCSQSTGNRDHLIKNVKLWRAAF